MPEVIEKVNISEEVKEKFGTYAKYIIQDRALPDVRDGLKPVQRRILYGMLEEGNVNDKPYRKAAKLVGAIMGNYHPHGDSSIYEAQVRLSQDWIMRHPLVDLHGNNGSIDGDSPASMRYTEVRLTKLAVEAMLDGVKKKGVIQMMDNFDGSEQEPTVLPAQIPNLLVNGASGISTGYATEIFPHNLGECLRACSALLENGDLTVAELMEYIPAPDFPTGGIITGTDGLRQMYETGKGQITVRSHYTFEQDKKLTRIVFTDIPYTLKKSKIIEKIDELIVGKKVAGLLDVRDETSREGLRIVVECQKETEQTVLNYLFKNTPLQLKLHMNMTVVHNRKPQVVNLKEALVAFNNFRKETKIREFTYEKNRLEVRKHIVEGFVHLVDNLQEVVAVIHNSEGKADAKQKIIEIFHFTEEQAEAIVVLPLHRISKQDKAEYEVELTKLAKAIAQLEGLLNSPKKLAQYMISKYDALAKQYATPRETELKREEENWEVNEMAIVAEEVVHVAISKQGYVKRSSARSFTATQTCGVKEDDEIIFEGQANTRHVVALITKHGRHAVVPVHQFEEMKWGDDGKHLSSYTALNDGETIVTAFTFNPETTQDLYTLVIKTNGQVRLSALEDCKVSRKTWYLSAFAKLAEGEEIAYVGIHSLQEAVGFTNHKEQKMYFLLSEIPVTSMRSGGVRGIHIKKDETILAYAVGTPIELEEQGFPYRERGNRGMTV